MTILTISLTVLSAALLIATLPLLVELLVLTVAALLPLGSAERNEENVAGPLRLSVIVPAHNEEAHIGRCVRSILASGSESVDVLVVAHNCSDNTAQEAEQAGARVFALDDPSQTGKGRALHYGFSMAQAEGFDAMLVIDADSVAAPNLIQAVRSRFISGAKVLQCRYEVHNADANQRTRLMSLAFVAFNVVRPRGRARLGLSAGIFGNGFGLHRDVIEKVPFSAHSVVEDLEYHLSLVRAGIRVEFLNSEGVLGEMPVGDKGAATQRSRWEGGRLRMVKGWSLPLLVDVLRGRIRLVEPLLDLVGLSLALEVLLLLVGLCLPVTWLRIYALAGFAVIGLHLLVAAAYGPGLRASAGILLAAPGYILWKLLMLPRIWKASRSDASWVRTHRDAPPVLSMTPVTSAAHSPHSQMPNHTPGNRVATQRKLSDEIV
jgi:cellulose synthase/poly-beta-1,6-N-acetylglucosamine synthase-like glycosyltransferase